MNNNSSAAVVTVIVICVVGGVVIRFATDQMDARSSRERTNSISVTLQDKKHGPTGISARQPWITSNVVGSPEPPPPLRTQVAFPKLKGFHHPTVLTNASGTDRLFVAEHNGKIFSFAPTPDVEEADLLIDIKKLVEEEVAANPDGPVKNFAAVYGMTFHPKFAENGLCYVAYVVNGKKSGQYADGTRVAQFHVTEQAGTPTIDPATQKIVITWLQGGHNGGCLKFGPDGYLYISTGDGGSGGDPGNRAANLNSMLGKMLRIDVDTQDAGLEYGIPADNAWANDGDSTTRDEIYHYGLRNAWRCSFDRDNGDMWLADVGQNAWEEVNHNVGNVGGLFYGWKCREGLVQYSTGNCGVTGWTDPQYVYNHSQGCSITGGYVYRGCELGTDFQGLYIFADYCTGDIWSLDPDNGYSRTTEFAAGFGVTSFGEDEDGELYYTSGSSVYKIVNPSAPDKDEDGIPDACAAGCPADLTDEGSLNFLDVSAFLSAFGKQNPIADFTGDGNYNFLDVSAFLAAFGEGCP